MALKVQRPNIPDGLELDFHLIRVGAAFADQFATSLNTSIVELVDEFATRVFQELNYEVEAANALAFQKSLAFLGFVDVPTCVRRRERWRGCD